MPSTYNLPESMHYPEVRLWFERAVVYSLAPMHAQPRTMEAFITASRVKRLKREEAELNKNSVAKFKYSPEYKKHRLEQLKLADQQKFIESLHGTRIGFPEKVRMRSPILMNILAKLNRTLPNGTFPLNLP